MQKKKSARKPKRSASRSKKTTATPKLPTVRYNDATFDEIHQQLTALLEQTHQYSKEIDGTKQPIVNFSAPVTLAIGALAGWIHDKGVGLGDLIALIEDEINHIISEVNALHQHAVADGKVH